MIGVVVDSSAMIAVVESVASRTKSEASLAELRELWAALKTVELARAKVKADGVAVCWCSVDRKGA